LAIHSPFDAVDFNVVHGLAPRSQRVDIFLNRGGLIFRLRFRGLAIVFVEESGEKVYVHHAAIRGHRAQHVGPSCL
jgi:hypothetical protein